MRASGILLPIFSLPGGHGIGCFNQEAYKWIDYLKKNHKYKNIDIYEISEFYFNNESFEDSYIDKDNLLNLYKKIFSLDDNSKNVVLLRVKSDFSFKEISQILGKSESWARTTYYRAKLKLKEMIDNEEK